MADSNTTPEKQAEYLLTESVSVPEFTRKLAAEYGFTPDAENHVDIRVLADGVYRAAHGFAVKRAGQAETGRKSAIKAAVDAAFAVAGQRPPSHRPAVDAAAVSGEYEKLAGVMDAAALLTGGKPKEEDEDEAKKKAPVCAA